MPASSGGDKPRPTQGYYIGYTPVCGDGCNKPKCAARSAQMMELLSRDPATQDPDPDHQAKFTGPVLPAGAKLWSKAGWTSETRHDATYIELPNGAKFVLVVFSTGHAHEREILRTAARIIVEGMPGREA